eukprot:403360842
MASQQQELNRRSLNRDQDQDEDIPAQNYTLFNYLPDQQQVTQQAQSLFGNQYQQQELPQNFNLPQYQMHNQELLQVPIESLNQTEQQSIEIAWTKNLKVPGDSIDRAAQLIGNVQGFVTKENPRKQLVYANDVLRVIDLSQSQPNMQLQEVLYKDKDLVYCSFKGNYLITNYIQNSTQQSFLEVKRLSNTESFANSTANQPQDYLSCELEKGTTITKAHIFQYQGYLGIEQADSRMQVDRNHNTDLNRELLIILRRNSSIIEIKQIKRAENQILTLNVIEFQQIDKNTGLLYKIEDFKIFESKMVINYENQYVSFFDVQGLLNQTSNVFSSSDSQTELTHFNLDNPRLDNNTLQFKMNSVDLFMFQQQPFLIITKESQSGDVAHQLEVYAYDYVRLVKVCNLIPTFGSDIEHTQEYQELLNLEQMNNQQRGNLFFSTCSAQDLILKNQTRKILDTESTDFAFFILAKEGRSIILYMIDRYTSDIQVQQVNKGQLLKGGDSNRIVDELLGARIMIDTLDQQPDGIQVDIMVLSSQGTQVSQLRINNVKTKLIQECSQLDRQALQQIPQKAQNQFLNQQNNIIFDYNDPQMRVQSKVQSSLDLVHKLLSLSQYKKLAEYVFMKANDRDQSYVFEELGALQQIMQARIEQQRLEDTAQLLSSVKHYQVNFDQNFSYQIQFKKRLEQDISLQVLKLEGFQTVFSAIVKREQETLKSNQIKASDALESNKQNIERIQRYIVEKLEKQTNFCRLLLFLVQSQYLPSLYHLQIEQHEVLSKIARDIQQEGTCISYLFKQSAPDLLQYYPMTEIEQIISLFDQSVLPEKPLTIIYYQILELQALNRFSPNSTIPNFGPFFSLHLSHLLSTQTQEQIKVLWTLDHLDLQHLFGDQDIMASEIVLQLLNGNRKFAEMDHLVLQKLIQVGQSKHALDFVLQGGCSLPNQLNNEQILSKIIELLRNIISQNKVQSGLFHISLTLKQNNLVKEYLEQNHPDLLLSFNTFQRSLIQGIAQDLAHSTVSQQDNQNKPFGQMQQPIGGMFQQLKPSKANDLKSLLHVNYLAAIGDEKRQAVYQSTGQPLSQVEFMISEKQSQYSANQKFNHSGNRLSNMFGSQQNNMSGRVVPVPQISNVQQMNHSDKLQELKYKFMADPFFAKNEKLQNPEQNDFFKEGQEESKALRVESKNQKVVKSFGMLGKVDEPFTYKEDLHQKDALRIYSFQIKDYDQLQQEQLRQSLSPNKTRLSNRLNNQGVEGMIRTSPNRMRQSPDADLFIPTDPLGAGSGLNEHDDLLRDTGDLDEFNQMQNDYDEDDIAVVPGLTGNRMTAGFGQNATMGGQYDNTNDYGRDISAKERGTIQNMKLSTINESAELNMSMSDNRQMSNLIQNSSALGQQRLPQRYSMDQRASNQGASAGIRGSNPFIGSSGAGDVAQTQSLNLQKSEIYLEDEDLAASGGHLGFQDYEDEELNQDYDLEDEDDEDELDRLNYPNESPEQRKARRQKNIMLRKQAEDVRNQKGFSQINNVDQTLTRSEARKQNIQADDHISLTPAHKK